MSIDFSQLAADKILALPDDKFGEIYRLARIAADGGAQGAIDFIHQLRRRLVTGTIPRKPSWMRMLCLPFEDFLVNEQSDDSGTIPRALLAPMLAAIAGTSGPAFDAAFKTAQIVTDKDPTPEQIAFYDLAAAEMDKIRQLVATDRGERKRLFGEGQADLSRLVRAIELLKVGAFALVLKRGHEACAPGAISDPCLQGIKDGLVQIPRIAAERMPAFIRLICRLHSPEELMTRLDAGALLVSREIMAAVITAVSDAAHEEAVKELAAFEAAEETIPALQAISAYGKAMTTALADEGQKMARLKEHRKATARMTEKVRDVVNTHVKDLASGTKEREAFDAIRMLNEARVSARAIGLGSEIDGIAKKIEDDLTKDVRGALKNFAASTAAEPPDERWFAQRLRLVERLSGPVAAEALYLEMRKAKEKAAEEQA